MALSHELVGPKTAANIKVYILTRSELLCSLCYEIPCILSAAIICKSHTTSLSIWLCKNSPSQKKYCLLKNATELKN